MATATLPESPLGPITVAACDGQITQVMWGTGTSAQAGRGILPEQLDPDFALAHQATLQLEAYFARRRATFNLPLAPARTPFQARVRQGLLELVYGQTLTYGALAAQLETSPRAIGGALAVNPLPIFVPCHRILAVGEGLGGYCGAENRLDIKQKLLKLEQDNGKG